MKRLEILMALMAIGMVATAVSAWVVIPNTYGNYSEVTAYGTNVLGWHMAWVTARWTFATSSTGQFLLDRNTYIETTTGGHLDDYGSWDYTQAIPSYNELEFWGAFTLHGVEILGNELHGTLYDRVKLIGRTSDGRNYQYAVYYGVNSIAHEQVTLPVEFEISIEA